MHVSDRQPAAKAIAIEDFERGYLAALIDCCDGNITKAAAAAGLGRNHLRALLKKHGLYDPRPSSIPPASCVQCRRDLGVVKRDRIDPRTEGSIRSPRGTWGTDEGDLAKSAK